MNGWWERDDLRYADDRLMFAGRSAADLAYQYGSPSFFYSARRVAANLTRLHAVLDTAGFAGRHRLNYAMKANRFAPLLTWMKTSGLAVSTHVLPRRWSMPSVAAFHRPRFHSPRRACPTGISIGCHGSTAWS